MSEQNLILPVSRTSLLRWFKFESRDIDFLSERSCSGEPYGVWIVSVYCEGYAFKMLARCGEIICRHAADVVGFRTSNPVVEAWAERFNALRISREGHRPRYLLAERTSPEFFELCVKACARDLNERLACCALWR